MANFVAVKNTGGSGTPTLGDVETGDTLPITAGGTGRATSTTAYALLAAGTTATGVQQTLASAGTSGQALLSGGASALPAWGTLTVSNGGTNATTVQGARASLGFTALAALTSSSNATAIDMAASVNFSLAMTEDTKIGNPTNAPLGQQGIIVVTQNAGAAKLLTYDTHWIEEATGAAPSMSTTLSAVNMLVYRVVSSTKVFYSLRTAGVA